MRVIEINNVSIAFELVKRYRSQIRKSFLELLAKLFGNKQDNDKEIFRALSDIDLKIEEGDSVGFIGKNGAGKSTLFRLISGVYKPDEGSIKVNGKLSAVLSLGAGLNAELSGRENIRLYGLLMGLSTSLIDERMSEIIDFAELGTFIDQPIKFYSSGMKSRLAFSVAAAIEPEILLLDEVLAVGDAGFREKCEKRLDEMMAKAKAILIVSHNLSFIRSACNRVVWLHEGKVIMDGEASKVVTEYENFMKGKGEINVAAR